MAISSASLKEIEMSVSRKGDGNIIIRCPRGGSVLSDDTVANTKTYLQTNYGFSVNQSTTYVSKAQDARDIRVTVNRDVLHYEYAT